MKKIKLALCLVLLAACVSCGGSPKKIALGNKDKNPKSLLEQNFYSWEDHKIKGMEYRIYYFKRWSSDTGYAIEVINLTKDELEVELLKKQLNK